MPDTSSGPSRTAIHFGAGNIGRGFIGPLLARAGFHVVFADINESLISEINNIHSYDVHFLEPRRPRGLHVENISGVMTNSEQLVNDIADEETKLITTSVGIAVLKHIAPVVARGLIQRKKNYGEGGEDARMNVIACENGKGATDVLKEEVFRVLDKEGNEEDKKWVEENIGFANCTVDRIVPPFEHQENPLDVGVEGFHEWIVDTHSLKFPPRSKSLSIPGMALTDNLPAYVERKLFTLNCGHAIAAYLGSILGLETIYDAINNESHIFPIVGGAMRESSAALAKKYPGLFDESEREDYISKTLERFKNPAVVDNVSRVGRNPLRKLGRDERLMGPLYLARRHNLPVKNLAMGIAATLMYRNEEDQQAMEIGKIIAKSGLEEAIVEITGLEKGSEEWNEVIQSWNVLDSWKKEAT